MTQTEKLEALRKKMKELKVNGFFVPMADQFQNEYVPKCFERLKWISGFTGSSGWVVILEDKAAFFTDGRYTIQAREEIDADCFEIYSTSEDQDPTPTLKPHKWIEENLGKNAKFLIDSMLHTASDANKIIESVEGVGSELVCSEDNLIDLVWKDRSDLPSEQAFIHPLEYAGKASADKISDVIAVMKRKNTDYLVITAPESICWLLNVRGGDVNYNPLVLSYALLDKTGKIEWFVDDSKLSQEVIDWVSDSTSLSIFGSFSFRLKELAIKGGVFWLDSSSAPYQFERVVEMNGGVVFGDKEPIELMKAKKNEVEIKGTIQAHIRDGVALTRFLNVLDNKGKVAELDEMSAAALLDGFRAENDKFKGLSFPTISGVGDHGAIIHYMVNEKSNKPLSSGEVYLVDSGAHYLDGTTDVTRTVAVGEVTGEMKDRFTRVLKGHIKIATAEFSYGETGNNLDKKARVALEAVGLDYAHGTGHGVGCFLSVHEGPCNISPTSLKTPLEVGMIISNEPGYYKEGCYGIRIENLLTVVDTNKKDDDEKSILGFRTITLAPIDKSLINMDLLNNKELKWLNSYHLRVRKELTPLLEKTDSSALKFLEKATQPL